MAVLEFAKLIQQCTDVFTPVIDSSFAQKHYVYIDLSGKNKELNKIEIPSAGEYKKYTDEYLAKKRLRLLLEVITKSEICIKTVSFLMTTAVLLHETYI